MINKKTKNEILKHCDGINILDQVGGNIFFYPPTQHIFSGFFLDSGSINTYFGHVCVPICDQLSFIGPGFGGRLKEISNSMKVRFSDADIASEFSRFIHQEREHISTLKDADIFLNFFYTNYSIENEHQKRGIAFLFILRGQIDEGLKLMEELQLSIENTKLKPDWISKFESEIRYILKLCKENPILAQNKLLEWEKENKIKFSIR